MPPAGLTIDVVDPRAPELGTLLARHHDFVRQHSPPEDIHALDLTGLCHPSITFCAGRLEGTVVVMGALKHLDAEHAEIKSMHVLSELRGQGLGAAMVDHLLDLARVHGYRQVSLETGSTAAFSAAHTTYARAGFVEGGRRWSIRRLPG